MQNPAQPSQTQPIVTAEQVWSCHNTLCEKACANFGVEILYKKLRINDSEMQAICLCTSAVLEEPSITMGPPTGVKCLAVGMGKIKFEVLFTI